VPLVWVETASRVIAAAGMKVSNYRYPRERCIFIE